MRDGAAWLAAWWRGFGRGGWSRRRRPRWLWPALVCWLVAVQAMPPALFAAEPRRLPDAVAAAQAGAAAPGRGQPSSLPAAAPTATAPRRAGPVPTPTVPAGPAGRGAARPADALGALRFINPIRVLDTRADSGGPIGFNPDGSPLAAGAFQGGQTRRFKLAGQTFAGTRLPDDLTGVLLNVTIVQTEASGGFVTVFPGDVAAPPNASTVNPATAIAANFWATAVPQVGANAGTVAVFSTNGLHVLLDVVGYYSPSNPAAGATGAVGPLKFVNPVRVLDTRADSGGPIGFNPDGTPVTAAPLNPGVTRRFKLAGQSFSGQSFPADISGILAHVTLVQPQASGGFVTLFPGDAASPPNASTVNPSTAIAFNSWATGLPATGGSAGTFALFSTNTAHVIVDVVGYFAPSNPPTLGDLSLVAPLRVLDTRADSGGPIGFDGAGAPLQAAQLVPNASRRFAFGGKGFPGGSLPADVSGVLANVTIVQRSASGGFVTAYPGNGTLLPNVSTVNPSTGIAASFWANGLASGGPYAGLESVYSTNALDVIVDVVGYFRPSPPPAAPELVAPPLPPANPIDFASGTSFLYTGADPIQTGVVAGTLVPTRTAVLRGRVLTRDGQPLPNVTVSILSHPELGQTRSRLDGAYDLAVNGGGQLVVDLVKEGFLSAQRAVDAPWQDYAALPDVVLTPLDPAATTIDLTSTAPMQVARGSVVTDGDGTRRATLLFARGTQASLQLADGSTRVLTPTLTVRASEYTVGASGPAAMPAGLPPSSNYTYAAGYTVDEALAMGAVAVNFSQPVVSYTENFIGMPVGAVVPVGYYDRQQGIWVPSANGRIVKVLSVSGGLAQLDLDGSGTPAGASALAAQGITDAERAQVAQLFQPGQSLTRFSLTHFTDIDPNFVAEIAPGAQPPQPPPVVPVDRPLDNPCVTPGSIIDCEGQSLGEVLPVIGTPFQLHYQSSRMPGNAAARTAQIRLIGATVAPGLKRIELETQIAGQTATRTFGITPNQLATFTWDGKDAYGRTVQGTPTLHYRLTYVYDGVYKIPLDGIPETFTYWGGATTTLNRARAEISFTIDRDIPLGSIRGAAMGPGLGGWTLDVQQTYDPQEGALYGGDGTRVTAQSSAPFGVSTVAGNGNSSNGANGNALQVGVSPEGITVGPDGTVYFSESFSNLVRRVGPDGRVVLVAGSGAVHGSGGGGDGGPATLAELSQPVGLAIGRDGSLYIADQINHRVRRVTPDGIIHAFAGKISSFGTFSGDDGPATAAGLFVPAAVAIGPDGSVFIADTGNCRVRRVGNNGLIATVAGNGTCGFAGDGGQARAAQISHIRGLAVGRDGTLYIGDGANHRVRRVRPDGTISTYAGNGTEGADGDGGPATAAQLKLPGAITLSPTGDLYIVDGDQRRVRVVTNDGIINTFAGGGAGAQREGQPAQQAFFSRLTDIAYGPDSALYLALPPQNAVRRIRPPQPDLAVADMLVPSLDSQQVFRISQGRHTQTLHGLTGAVLYSFTYDTAGRLSTIVDNSGNTTTIQRDGAGNPTAIVAPFGQRTTFTVNGDGYLANVTNPAGETTSFLYSGSGGGLMTSLTDPRGGSHQFTYDAQGRLTRDTNPLGGFTSLARTNKADGYTVTRANSLGEATVHDVTYLSSGDLRRVVTGPSGAAQTSVLDVGGTSRVTDTTGVASTSVTGPDARFGLFAPVETSVTTRLPSGSQQLYGLSQTVQTTNPNDPFGFTGLTSTASVNGVSSTSQYTAAARTLTQTSSAGRTASLVTDQFGRPLQQTRGNLLPQTFTYNALGQLTAMTQGTGTEARTTTYTYNAAGFKATSTDAEGRPTSFVYDAAGRLTGQTLPGGRTVAFSYDANGNQTATTPPGRPAHTAAFDGNQQVTDRTLPDVGGGIGHTATTYNAEGRPVGITRPDGSTIGYAYDSAGRRTGVTIARGAITYAYDAAGRETAANAPGGIGLTTTYDGSLPTGVTVAGPVPGVLTWQYDANQRPGAPGLNGDPPMAYFYDADGLLVLAGLLILTNDPQTGYVTGTRLALVEDSTTYNGFGEPATYAATAGGTLYGAQYTRDRLGRITALSETIGGVTTPITFAYDAAGRLSSVTRNGVTTATYSYDANGNRTGYTGAGGPAAGTYDNRDRLLQYGAATYTYNAAGDLTGRTNGAGTTSYQYDALGNLVAATLPGGTQLSYLIDARDRRVGKRVNGTLVQGFLYQDNLRPIAELDGAGAVVSRFVYGYGVNSPDYMVKGGVAYRLIHDHTQSVRLVVDTTTGAVVQRLDYDEYGRVTLDTSPGFQPFGFGGGLYDRDTGLVRFGFRDYDAETGRWTTPDPTGFASGDTNFYAYVAGDPVNLTDSLGTGWGRTALFAGLTVIALASGIGSVVIAAQAITAASTAVTTAAAVGYSAVAVVASANAVAGVVGAGMNANQILQKGPDVTANDLYPTSALSAATVKAPTWVQNIAAVADVVINHSLSIQGASALAQTANRYLSTLPTWTNDIVTNYNFQCQMEDGRRQFDERRREQVRRKWGWR